LKGGSQGDDGLTILPVYERLRKFSQLGILLFPALSDKVL
jgi:hypothetical protein